MKTTERLACCTGQRCKRQTDHGPPFAGENFRRDTVGQGDDGETDTDHDLGSDDTENVVGAGRDGAADERDGSGNDEDGFALLENIRGKGLR